MKKIISILSLLVVFACNPTSPIEKPQEQHEAIVFSLEGKPTVVAIPDDELSYTVKASYSQGISQVGAYLNGKLIEGSLKDYKDNPKELTYSFTYKVNDSQVGETLDFVVEAKGADSYLGSIDFPVYIKSINTEVSVTLPELLPKETMIGETIELDIFATTGYNIQYINVLKGETVIDNKTEGFSEAKSDNYHFSYTTTNDDKKQTLHFTIEVCDVKGYKGYAEFEFYVRGGDVKELYSELFDTSINISGTREFDTEVGGISGNAATNFTPGHIASYAGDNEAITEGIKESTKVYDGDVSVIKYTFDGVDVCLSKYKNAAVPNVSGTYLWFRQNKAGWIAASGIKLHGCTELTFSYLASGGTVKILYALEDSEQWTEVATEAGPGEHIVKFSVPSGSTNISLKIQGANTTPHPRIDNLKLLGE